MRVFVGRVVNPVSHNETQYIDRAAVAVLHDGTIAFFEDLACGPCGGARNGGDGAARAAADQKSLTFAEQDTLAELLLQHSINSDSVRLVELPQHAFLMPGFVDTHTVG